MAVENSGLPGGNGQSPLPERLTLEEYKKLRREHLSVRVLIGSLMFLILGTVPLLLIAVGLIKHIFLNDGPGRYYLGLFLLPLAVWLTLRVAVPEGSVPVRARTVFLETAPEEDLARWKKARRIRMICLLCVFAAALLFLPAVDAVLDAGWDRVYTDAEELIKEELYREAEYRLRDLLMDRSHFSRKSPYKDTDGLIAYCRARQWYAQDLVSAYSYLKNVSFGSETERELPEIALFRAQVEEEYADYQRSEEKRKALEFEDRIDNGVPFPGMPESRIGDTTLGKPNAKRIDTEKENGKTVTIITYVFYENGKTVFIARCEDGTVIRIWDYRSRPLPVGSGTLYFDPGPDPDDYPDAQDMYDMEPDDFYDYEDAEDYWESHVG